MATFDYFCRDCEHEWDERRPIDYRDAPAVCPNCHSEDTTRVMTSPRIVSGVNAASKVPHGFRDVLKKIKKAHPHNKIDGEMS